MVFGKKYKGNHSMNLNIIVLTLFLTISLSLQAKNTALTPEQLIQQGQNLDAAKEYATRINQSANSGDKTALHDACIGLYKVLWLNQAQDKAEQLFKPCSLETMDWLTGNVDRDYQLIRRTIIQFPPGMIYHVLDNPITFKILFDLDVSGTPTNVRINGLQQIGGPRKTRIIEQSLMTQVMQWRYLPRIDNKRPVVTIDVPSDVTFSAERR
jgi:hypothetical protein